MRAHEHISTEEILRDIADTELEIATMTAEAEHLQKTPLSLSSAKWDHLRASVSLNGIAERQEFIAKLKVILDGRGVQP